MRCTKCLAKAALVKLFTPMITSSTSALHSRSSAMNNGFTVRSVCLRYLSLSLSLSFSRSVFLLCWEMLPSALRLPETEKHKNRVFSLWCHSRLYETSTSRCLISLILIDLQLLLVLMCESQNLIISGLHCWAGKLKAVLIKEVKLRVCCPAVRLCCMHDVPVCCPAEHEICHQRRVSQQLTFVETV